MRTVNTGWEKFRAVCLKQGMPPEQIFEMRVAFFAGAATVLGVLTEISRAEVSEAAGVGILEGMHQELRDHRGSLVSEAREVAADFQRRSEQAR